MARTFFYTVLTEDGTDITEKIESFGYEEAQDKDDLLTLNIRDDAAAFAFIDGKQTMPGRMLTFSFGIVGGTVSGKKTARICARNARYGANGAVLEIQACDLGLSLKKTEKSIVWAAKTISEIVQSIAESNGLEHSIDPTTQRYDYMPQQNRTDWAFLQYLASIEKGGSIRVFVRANKLYFTRLKLEIAPARLFSYSPDGNIISFNTSEQGITQSGASKSVETVSYDPINDKTHRSKSENGTTQDDKKLGDYDAFYDADGKETGRKPALQKKGKQDEKSAGKIVNVVSGSGQETQNIADKMKKDAAMSDVSASLTTPLDASLQPDTVITVSGVAIYHAGNYYVKAVRHDLKSGLSVLELNRNAVSIKNAENKAKNEAADVEKKPAKGGEEAKKEVPRVRIDANGNILN